MLAFGLSKDTKWQLWVWAETAQVDWFDLMVGGRPTLTLSRYCDKQRHVVVVVVVVSLI